MKTICILADRHTLYDDRTYWKQAISLVNHGFDVHYVVIGDQNGDGITKEGIRFRQIKRYKYLPQRYLNYIFKKLPVKTEYDEAFEYCKDIKADIYQIEDLRLNRIIHKLKRLQHHPKLVYDIREPRDNNLKDITFRDSWIPKFLTNAYADHIQRWEYKNSVLYDHILAVDDGIYNRVIKNVPEVPVSKIYNFTNLKSTRQNVLYEQKKYDAAYVGGISQIRGAKMGLLAAKIIIKKIPDFKLLYLGPIYEMDLKNEMLDFVKQNNLENNVIFEDFVPYEKISDYYNLIKIGLNPLLYAKAHLEIIQIKLFEYMNYGIPIITSNFGYMQKYVEDNEVGITIAPGDAEALANAVIKLLSDRALYDKFSSNGIKVVDEKFSWEIMEKKLISIYEELLQ